MLYIEHAAKFSFLLQQDKLRISLKKNMILTSKFPDQEKKVYGGELLLEMVDFPSIMILLHIREFQQYPRCQVLR